ncbi:hypothetical protein CAPTEDRAFT_218769 [Capitella teleta]|uniref:MutL C-terminal dimerisation domain-containing protein n=1 Tax=Capitella teleta TaxID=283909 RepID=R7TBT2_CAPTE|nr:hypothetical protein CAPTEDRAFT_218769 [Capitella teleta]|eukprot:ELT88556.1 hypothetical protein CAPTEDRAFT_218769 [Capitella teleta]
MFTFRITGFVSRPEHGVGRGSCDRQFYFINRRPCDPQKISRVVNEAYHMFNRHQFPFVLLNISLVNDAVDVNVTPDKRQVFIQHEKLLLATLKASLVKLFEQKSTSYSLNQPESSSLSSSAPEVELLHYKDFLLINQNALLRQHLLVVLLKRRVPINVPKVIEKETLIAQEGELPVQSESWTALKTKDSIANNFQVPADPETLNITFTETDQKLKLKDPRREISVPFDMNALKTTLQSHSAAEKASQLNPCSTFRAKIDPTDNQSAEEELRREIKKESFCAMEILGQFNLGFVIARLNQDLFIIDQHASDEKYNFEMLQKHTVLSSQRLVCPQILPLTAANEVILMDNLDIFKRNGFAFEVDEEGPPTQRVKLVSKPISKNWEFGRDDIEELVFMLSDSSGIMCRPTRVRQMLASRACRKSIMIGTALNQPEMNKLLRHMSEIEHPWNCPHGRPTMRHLINLDRIKVCE